MFVMALTIRSSHRDHDFQRDMHDVTEQIDRLAIMVLLVLFGGAGQRPARLLELYGRPAGRARAAHSEKLTLAFFGIRGVGSFYYLAFGLNHMAVDNDERP